VPKIIRKLLPVLALLGLGYLLFWPIAIQPAAYTPPPNPGLKDVFEPNERLQAGESILKGHDIGPEAIVFGPDSMFYTGFENGDIMRFNSDGSIQKVYSNTGGRPLGLKFDKQKNLIVADALKGLLSIDSIGTVSLLTNEVAGTKIFYADDLDIAEDGTIYFSDATQRNRDIKDEIMELQPSGRLLSYNPATKATKVELEGMRFANGVAIGPNGEYLMVNETFGMLINKYWLKGPKRGQKEIWINQLPGFPDNITYNGDGIFWLALPNLRTGKEFEYLFDKPFLRKMLARLPQSVLDAQEPKPYGCIIGLNEEGHVIHNFQDPTGRINTLTSALEIDGYLYLGSLEMDRAVRLKLPE